MSTITKSFIPTTPPNQTTLKKGTSSLDEPSVLFQSALDIINEIVPESPEINEYYFRNNSNSSSNLFSLPSLSSRKEITITGIPTEIKNQIHSEKLKPYLDPEKIKHMEPQQIIEAAHDSKNFKDPDLLVIRDKKDKIDPQLFNNLLTELTKELIATVNRDLLVEFYGNIQNADPLSIFEKIKKVDTRVPRYAVLSKFQNLINTHITPALSPSVSTEDVKKIDIIKLFIEANVDLNNIETENGYSILMWLIDKQRPDLAEILLLSSPKTINKISPRGTTALTVTLKHIALNSAFKNRYFDLLDDLLSHSLPETINAPNENKQTIITPAIASNEENLAKKIISLSSSEAINRINLQDQPLYMFAMIHKKPDLAQELLNRSLPKTINAKDVNGGTGIMYAIIFSYPYSDQTLIFQNLARELIPLSTLETLIAANAQGESALSFLQNIQQDTTLSLDIKGGYEEITQLIKTAIVINYANYNIKRNDYHLIAAKSFPQEFYENIPDFYDADGKKINSYNLKGIIGDYYYGSIDEITSAMAAINQDLKNKKLPQITPDIEKFLEFIETEGKAGKATPK